MDKSFLDKDGLSRYTERMNKKIEDSVSAKAGKAETFSVTIPAAAWVSSTNNATVSDSRFTQNGYSYHVSPDENTYVTYGTCGVFAKSIPVDGSMIFHCLTIPEESLVVNIMKVESEGETN